MNRKLQRLKEIVAEIESALIAYSGGLDSTFLLKVAHDVLADKVMAVTASSLTYPSAEMEWAKKMAERLRVRHLIITTDELSNPDFINNPLDRCYWCKKELFSRLAVLAEQYNLSRILDGSNYDDLRDYRPGMKAAGEFGVRSPLREACLGKAEIRKLSRELGLATWDKPALACLASRFPYGMTITKERLKMVNEAEEFLRALGIKQVRVRHHDTIARIEVPAEEISKVTQKKLRDKIVHKLKGLGYRYVTVDVEGYRTGSMNPVKKDSFSDVQVDKGVMQEKGK